MPKSMYYVNRELSWLDFNARVLMNADDVAVPLCERLNFFTIFQSNLDEFFMVRIGSLHDEMLLDNGAKDNKTGMIPSQQIEAALDKIRKMCQERDSIYLKLLQELSKYGIHIVRFSEISPDAEKNLRQLFQKDVRPYLSYYNIRQKKDFPFLNNREIYAIAIFQNKREQQISIVPCKSSVVPRLIAVPGEKGRFILLEELILHYLPVLFPDHKIWGKTLCRITRNADIDADAIYDEDLNYRDHMAEIIRRRKRLNPVRLELSRQIDKHVIDNLCDYMDLTENQVFEYDTPLELSYLHQFSDMLRNNKELFYRPFTSRKQFFPGSGIIDAIQKKDLLLHYPYDNFQVFLSLLHEAAVHPKVRAIRMTLYRLAGQSKVVEALADAAENGKDVQVFMELKARFDEENNIEWSRRLEDAGCKVIYGIEHIKVHSKLCLITVQEDDGEESYITQIGTGNYNEKTSRIYTDLSLMTADQQIGKDGDTVFQSLIAGTTNPSTRDLLVAPKHMEDPLIKLIERETEKGEKGRILLKINSLTDKMLMEKLIEASCAGVQIRMVVRGICCLKPLVPGKTENIRIISIVGRYLEHSRIYLFGEGEDRVVYLSSADWMTRNMTRRVEIACPVKEKAFADYLEEVIGKYFEDNVQCWELNGEGTYVHRHPDEAHPAFHAQEFFYEFNRP